MTSKNLVSIGMPVGSSFEKNLKLLIEEINKAPSSSIILAPEVCITNFYYKDMNKASEYSKTIQNEILKNSQNKTICTTLIDKQNEKYFNNAYIFHNKKIVYKRAKNKLFKLADEHLYFKTDKEQEKSKEYNTNIVEIDNVKIAVLICFELRSIDEWNAIKGCDIVLIPAQWGKSRIKHFKTLSKALAITNQCFVINANNPNIAKCHQVISPFGIVQKTKKISNIINVDLQEIEKMRRYIVL